MIQGEGATVGAGVGRLAPPVAVLLQSRKDRLLQLLDPLFVLYRGPRLPRKRYATALTLSSLAASNVAPTISRA